MATRVDKTNFAMVNFVFFLVILYFTFSRSECPCPKHFTGREGWDPAKHWMVRDFKFVMCNGEALDRNFESSVTGSEMWSCTWSKKRVKSCYCARARLSTDQDDLW